MGFSDERIVLRVGLRFGCDWVAHIEELLRKVGTSFGWLSNNLSINGPVVHMGGFRSLSFRLIL